MAKKQSADLTSRLLELNKQYDAFKPEEYIESDIMSLDIVLGGKGIPKGKFIEVCSPSGLGKSTLLLHMARNLCEKGNKVLWIDAEGAGTESIIDGVGLKEYVMDEDNPEGNFILYKACLYGQIEEILDSILSTGEIDFVVIDSLTAIVPDALGIELEDKQSMSIMAQRPGFNAQIQTKFLQKYTSFKIKYNITFFFINQQRTKINITGFGAPTSVGAAGGNAVAYSMDCRLELGSAGKITEKSDTLNGMEPAVIGANVWIQSVKSRFSQPFIKVPGVIYFGKGYSNIMTLAGFMKMKQVEFEGKQIPMVSQSGAYFTVTANNEQKKVQGNIGLKNLIEENYDMLLSNFDVSDFSLIKGNKSINDIDSSEVEIDVSEFGE